MKAIIQLDVPEWQIGQEVKVYFPDSMIKTGKCEKAKIVQKPELLPKRIKKLKKKQNNKPKFDPVQFLIEEHRRNTAIQRCPIKINMDPLKGPVDTEEQVAEKWEAIKQWYKDHPEANAPWIEWENNQKELAKTFHNDFLTRKE